MIFLTLLMTLAYHEGTKATCEGDAEYNFYLGHEAGMKEYAEYYGLPYPIK